MFVDMARLVAERGTCERAQVGAVLVRDGRVISMGYNGAPPGMDHCIEPGVGCEVEQVATGPAGLKIEVEGCARTVHAEANAIAFAARAGISTEGTEMYCTHAPCYTCAKLMLSAGIKVCHYNIEYRDERGLEILKTGGVAIVAHQ